MKLTAVGRRQPHIEPHSATSIADHRFLFLIAHDRSSSILFMGLAVNTATAQLGGCEGRRDREGPGLRRREPAMPGGADQ